MARANSSGTSALTRAVAARSVTVPTMRRRMAVSASPQKICVTRRRTMPRSGWPSVVVWSARSSRDRVVVPVDGERDLGNEHAAETRMTGPGGTGAPSARAGRDGRPVHDRLAPSLEFAGESADAQSQRVQADEALGVALVVDRVLLEGREGLAVERARRLAADDLHRPLEQLEPHGAHHVLLAL